jgi:hypothetical protein
LHGLSLSRSLFLSLSLPLPLSLSLSLSECLGNELHGLSITRMCVGIDDGVFLSAVYGYYVCWHGTMCVGIDDGVFLSAVYGY